MLGIWNKEMKILFFYLIGILFKGGYNIVNKLF